MGTMNVRGHCLKHEADKMRFVVCVATLLDASTGIYSLCGLRYVFWSAEATHLVILVLKFSLLNSQKIDQTIHNIYIYKRLIGDHCKVCG